VIPVRLKQGLALARDWIAPGEAIAQWTHFVTSICNARCAHCFYPINAGKNELTLEEIERFVSTLPPIRLLLISGGEPFLRRDLPDLIRVYFERCDVLDVGVPTGSPPRRSPAWSNGSAPSRRTSLWACPFRSTGSVSSTTG
jgi:hypothetical protein